MKRLIVKILLMVVMASAFAALSPGNAIACNDGTDCGWDSCFEEDCTKCCFNCCCCYECPEPEPYPLPGPYYDGNGNLHPDYPQDERPGKPCCCECCKCCCCCKEPKPKPKKDPYVPDYVPLELR